MTVTILNSSSFLQSVGIGRAYSMLGLKHETGVGGDYRRVKSSLKMEGVNITD